MDYRMRVDDVELRCGVGKGCGLWGADPVEFTIFLWRGDSVELLVEMTLEYEGRLGDDP